MAMEPGRLQAREDRNQQRDRQPRPLAGRLPAKDPVPENAGEPGGRERSSF